MRSRVLAVVLLFVALVAIGLALSASLSSPVCLTLTHLEPSGVVDAAGTEFGLADIIVSNLTKGMLEFEWGKTEFDARVGGNWVACTPAVGEGSELLVNPRLLDAHQRRQVLMLVPPGADICRMRVNYQSELLQWRLWRQLGVRGQTFAVSRFPQFCKKFWPQGQFGERPPWGKAFRRPSHWKRFDAQMMVAGSAAVSIDSSH